MGKKQFIDKKFSKKFKLLPSSSVATEAPTEQCKPTKEQIEEQRKYGVFYDDNYDYMQHMRARDEGSVLLLEDEVRSIVRAPALPPTIGGIEKKVVFEADIESALEGHVEGSGDLEDDFITMAGGVVEERLMMPRMMKPLMEDDSDYEDEDEDEDMDFNRGYNEYDMEDEEEEENDETAHDDADRDVDAAFEAMLEADYNEDQVGELEGEACDLSGGIEPSDSRVRKLVGEKRGLPEYDEDVAKKYVRDRMKYLEKHGEEETEEVEVEVSASKKMKWDCESFATQYSNCYNHPSLIKEGGLSRRAIKRLEKKNAQASIEEKSEEEDEDMEDDDGESVCTTATTIRRRGETTEERKARKGAVKEARRQRRVEKKENQTAFAVEHRKATASRFGQIKTTPMV